MIFGLGGIWEIILSVRAGEIRRPPLVTVSDASAGGGGPACWDTGDRAAQGGAAGAQIGASDLTGMPMGADNARDAGLIGGALEGGA
jgi:hypothetical protein